MLQTIKRAVVRTIPTRHLTTVGIALGRAPALLDRPLLRARSWIWSEVYDRNVRAELARRGYA